MLQFACRALMLSELAFCVGRRRNSFGKRKRVNRGAVDQSRSRYSATQCS